MNTVAWFPNKALGTRLYDWALVDLSSLVCPPANQIRPPGATEHFSLTRISQTRPHGNVLIATRRGVLVGIAIKSDSIMLERFGIMIDCGCSVQLLNGHFGTPRSHNGFRFNS